MIFVMLLTFSNISLFGVALAFALACLWSCKAKNGTRLKVFQSIAFYWTFEFLLSLLPVIVLMLTSKVISPSALAVTTIMLLVSFVNSWKHPWGLAVLALGGVTISVAFLCGIEAHCAPIALKNVTNYAIVCDNLWSTPLGANCLVGIWLLCLLRIWLAIKQFGTGDGEYHWMVKVAKAYEEAQT